jgi:hypothetical protein
LHSRAPTNDEENLPIAKFVSGTGLLYSNNILHSGQEVEKEKHVPNEDLEDTGNSLVALGETVASKERHVVKDNVLPTNPTSPLHIQRCGNTDSKFFCFRP